MEYPRMFEGRSGSRQTCIDELRFDADGNILKIVPTKTGVELDVLKNAKNQNQIFPVKVASSKSSGKTPNYYKPELAFDDSFDTIWEPDMNYSKIFLATYTPLADACDNECVTPLPSPIIYNPLYLLSRFSSSSTSIL